MQTLERSADGLDLQILNVSGFDLAKGAPDAIATNAGYGPASPHPLAEDLYSVNLATIAAHFGGLVNTNGKLHRIKAVQQGMKSVDFQGIIESVGHRVVTKTFAADDTLNKIARPLPRADFNPTNLAKVELLNALESQQENAEHPLLIGRASEHRTPPIDSWSLAILVTRKDVVNNDQLLIAQLFAEAGQLAQRHEVKTTIEFLESNPTLPELDGKGGSDRAWFTEADGNLVTAGNNLLGLAIAAEAMREQTAANGDKENIAPKIVLCSARLEYQVREYVRQADLPLEVVTNPDIASDHYYLLADPARQPAIGVQFIGRPDARRIQTWSLKGVGKLPIEYEGAGYVLHVDMSPAAISRKGIVRVDVV